LRNPALNPFAVGLFGRLASIASILQRSLLLKKPDIPDNYELSY
jgi:hypothetical protein